MEDMAQHQKKKKGIDFVLDAIAFLFILALFVFENETYSDLFGIIQIVFLGVFFCYALVRKRIYASKAYLWLGIFLLSATLTAIVNDLSIDNSEYAVIIKNGLRFTCLVLYLSLCRSYEKTAKYIAIAGIVCAGFILSSFIASHMQYSSLKYATQSRVGASIAGGNVNIVAMNMCFAFSSWLYLLTSSEERKRKVFCLLATIVVVASSLLTGSRKIILYYLAVLFMFMATQKRMKAKNIIVFMIAIAVGYYCVMNIEPLYYLIGHKIDFWGDISNTTLYNDSDAVRGTLRKDAWNLFLEHPLLGVGFGNTSKHIGQYAHNNIMEVLSSGGIVGFIAYYSAYIYVLFSSLRYVKVDKLCLLIFSTTLGLLVLEWFQVTYLYGVPWVYLAMCILYCEQMVSSRCRKSL